MLIEDCYVLGLFSRTRATFKETLTLNFWPNLSFFGQRTFLNLESDSGYLRQNPTREVKPQQQVRGKAGTERKIDPWTLNQPQMQKLTFGTQVLVK